MSHQKSVVGCVRYQQSVYLQVCSSKAPYQCASCISPALLALTKLVKVVYLFDLRAKCFSITAKIIGAATLPPPPPECSAKATTKISGLSAGA